MRDYGVPGSGGAGRWRAVRYENGQGRQCEAVSEDQLAAKLEKVTERLEADAPNMERPGADLIAFYLSPGRLPVRGQWSRKHAHTQRRLCERFAAPVIGAVHARTSRPGTCRRSSTPPRRRGRGTGFGA